MKLLTSLLALNETVFGIKNYQCEKSALPPVLNGQWSCDRTGSNQRGETCVIQCDPDHYLPRPGPAKRARCKIDEQNPDSKNWSFPDNIPEGGFKCLGKSCVYCIARRKYALIAHLITCWRRVFQILRIFSENLQWLVKLQDVVQIRHLWTFWEQVLEFLFSNFLWVYQSTWLWFLAFELELKITLAGCSKSVIDDISIENGRWHCPLHDDDAELVGPGLQCYAMCNDFYELHDGDGGHYSMNKFSKICKCSEENNRCHWARLDNVPVCKATKLNRIINGQTAEANSKPYMVSVAVKQKVNDGKGKKESSFFDRLSKSLQHVRCYPKWQCKTKEQTPFHARFYA